MTGRPTIYGRGSSSAGFDQTVAPVRFSEYNCATCRIKYVVQEGKDSSCPYCRLLKRNDLLEAELIRHEELEKRQSKVINNMRSQLDGLHGMIESAKAASLDEVRSIGKMVAALFRVKMDGPARLSPMYRKGTESPVGFSLSQYNAGELEYRCTTVGGVSLAMRYTELLRSYGSDVAEKALGRAVGQVLDNSINIDDPMEKPRMMPWEQ